MPQIQSKAVLYHLRPVCMSRTISPVKYINFHDCSQVLWTISGCMECFAFFPHVHQYYTGVCELSHIKRRSDGGREGGGRRGREVDKAVGR